MAEIAIKHLTKQFGAVTAVDDVSLEIAKGDLVSILGPSGCGKTTLLRMLGGFIPASAGDIEIQGRSVIGLPPHKRDTAMVFQSYALFPHLNVYENIAYGLRRRGISGRMLDEQVSEVMALVGITPLARRRPAALSGGQQQRTAVARALVLKPSVLLLDEPFSALDAQVRETTRVELRRIQKEAGITAIFVTHDQQEAMSISDHMVIMNRGRVEQHGSPSAVYGQPATRFVAEFVGGANLFPGRPSPIESGTRGFDAQAGFRIAPDAAAPVPDWARHAVIRAEDIRIAGAQGTGVLDNQCSGTVQLTLFLGHAAQVAVRLENGPEVVVRGDREIAALFPPGTRVSLRWQPGAVSFLGD